MTASQTASFLKEQILTGPSRTVPCRRASHLSTLSSFPAASPPTFRDILAPLDCSVIDLQAIPTGSAANRGRSWPYFHWALLKTDPNPGAITRVHHACSSSQTYDCTSCPLTAHPDRSSRNPRIPRSSSTSHVFATTCTHRFPVPDPRFSDYQLSSFRLVSACFSAIRHVVRFFCVDAKLQAPWAKEGTPRFTHAHPRKQVRNKPSARSRSARGQPIRFTRISQSFGTHTRAWPTLRRFEPILGPPNHGRLLAVHAVSQSARGGWLSPVAIRATLKAGKREGPKDMPLYQEPW